MRILSTIVNTARVFIFAPVEGTSSNTNGTKIRSAEAFCDTGRVAYSPPSATRPNGFERPVTYPLHSEDTLTTNGIRAFEICAKILGYVTGDLMIMFFSAHGADVYAEIRSLF